MTTSCNVEQWGIFEIALTAEIQGNPFLDIQISAVFQFKHRTVGVDGFYDGDGIFRVRFMPDVPGEWRFETISNCPALHGVQGNFTCTPATEGNHGPVRVNDTYHFQYEDGTPFYQVGTTCYVWTHQREAVQEQTLRTLSASPFNKLRMCVFPKHYYAYNTREPETFPFERQEDGSWDFTRFHTAFFQHLERRIGDLMKLGIEADIILFHSYDRWGFANMGAENDDRYLRYIVARLAAYRNVWWSMANEYDLMKEKSLSDWDRFFRIVQEHDHVHHPRSVHNYQPFYDHTLPWVTHASVQSSELTKIKSWRDTYNKPIVVDECCYEGNIEANWGDLTAREMLHRFWYVTVRGGYVGHGETYVHPEDILWWSHGGELYGESPVRLAFLRRIMEEGPAQGLEPVPSPWDLGGVMKGETYYLYYYGEQQPVKRWFILPENKRYRAEIIDTWEMTITPLDGLFSGTCEVPLPGKSHQAVRFLYVEDAS